MCQLLDIAGMSQGMAGQPVGRGATLTYVLLPYVVLSLAIILSQILLLTSRMLPDRKADSNDNDVEQPVKEAKPRVAAKKKAPEKTNQRGRPKKEEAAEKPSKEARKTTGEIAKNIESHS